MKKNVVYRVVAPASRAGSTFRGPAQNAKILRPEFVDSVRTAPKYS